MRGSRKSSEGGLGPFLHRGEGEEAVGVGAGLVADRRVVGLDAEGDRGRRRRRPAVNLSPARKGPPKRARPSAQSSSRRVRLRLEAVGHACELDADADIHAADVAQMAEAAMHFGARRSGPRRGRSGSVGPDVRVALGEIFDDGDAIPRP